MKDSKKSVVFVLGGLVSGGAERVASHLINYWYEQGVDVTLIVGHGQSEDFYSVPSEMKRIVVSNGSPSNNKLIALLKNIPIVWKLRKALKKTEAQTIISFLTRTNIYTILASLGLKKRVIVSERNDTTREEHPWPWPQLRRTLYKYADVVTANSDIALSGMEEYVRREKLTIVPNPVYLPDKKADPQDSKVIINVGRLVPQKAQHLLIEAFAEIDETKRKGWTVKIFGVGEEEDTLKKITKEKGLTRQVNFCGIEKNIEREYQEAGIFVLSSIYEGTPNALLEAMSFGLPCIISNTIPGAKDLIEHEKTGLVFSSGNADDLANKISTLIEDPEYRRQLGTNARKRVEMYSPENVLPVWNELL
jgi:GalNAc-alpha-(1->4)-GalNAc-alpha-(1->3)-diNAcBac-PP-undecaprenol alpha-1,4-N-acetyl-D-galactosaminyltransferase